LTERAKETYNDKERERERARQSVIKREKDTKNVRGRWKYRKVERDRET